MSTTAVIITKLIDSLPAILTALASVVAAIGATLAYVQSHKNGTATQIVTAAVVKRADSQDVTLHQIKEATNGGVQILRDTVKALEDKAVVDNRRIEDLEALVKQMVRSQTAP